MPGLMAATLAARRATDLGQSSSAPIDSMGALLEPDNVSLSGDQQSFCHALARHAARALYQELALYPKPGLVSLVDSGSHDDMDARTFMRSLFSLRRYFVEIGEAGMAGEPFEALKQLGIAAEQRMLRATGGINTHRGAIFCLGLLCAAIARCQARGVSLSAQAIRRMLLATWGRELADHVHSSRVGSIAGARHEGAAGFPSVFGIALPRLHDSLLAGRDWRCAKTDAFFALMARVSDTNVYRRGGERGAALVQARAQAFLDASGTARSDWMLAATAIHREFVSLRLSPGGAADLLAGACLVHDACGGKP